MRPAGAAAASGVEMAGAQPAFPLALAGRQLELAPHNRSRIPPCPGKSSRIDRRTAFVRNLGAVPKVYRRVLMRRAPVPPGGAPQVCRPGLRYTRVLIPFRLLRP